MVDVPIIPFLAKNPQSWCYHSNYSQSYQGLLKMMDVPIIFLRLLGIFDKIP